MVMKKRIAGGVAAFALAASTIGAAPAAASAEQAGPPDVASSGAVYKPKCKPGDHKGSKTLTPKKLYLRNSYYKSSKKLVQLSKGDSVGYYGSAKNKYGNTWYKVQYSNIQRDVCGWVSKNWAK